MKGQPRSPATVNGLTPRETEICALLAYGYTNPEIASKLRLSERTVETHRANLMAKLGIRTRHEVVDFAISHHLLTLE